MTGDVVAGPVRHNVEEIGRHQANWNLGDRAETCPVEEGLYVQVTTQALPREVVNVSIPKYFRTEDNRQWRRNGGGSWRLMACSERLLSSEEGAQLTQRSSLLIIPSELRWLFRLVPNNQPYQHGKSCHANLYAERFCTWPGCGQGPSLLAPHSGRESRPGRVVEWSRPPASGRESESARRCKTTAGSNPWSRAGPLLQQSGVLRLLPTVHVSSWSQAGSSAMKSSRLSRRFLSACENAIWQRSRIVPVLRSHPTVDMISSQVWQNSWASFGLPSAIPEGPRSLSQERMAHPSFFAPRLSAPVGV
ncbi:unnamed protein product [Symbiodinium natans]|uniref:Uncharacterized protein n=1 Tax=Symbiodinium natans TaxID=878477 RepID=A0A812R8W0_9DINO|nr:unnamed protein product [Symbiodinium natans]